MCLRSKKKERGSDMSIGDKGVLAQKGLSIFFVAAATSLALIMVGCGGSSDSSSGDGSASKENAAQEQSTSASVKNSVDDYTWEELSRISSEIAEASDEAGAIVVAKRYNLCTPDGKLDGTQEKSVTLSDGTETAVQIAGFWHDKKTDGGKTGITFMFKSVIAEHDMNSNDTNTGGWRDSQMRSWLNSDGMKLLPEDLRDSIVAVNKLTNNTGETTNTSSVTSTSDSLWLFSATELCGSINWCSDNGVDNGSSYDSVLNSEGSQYQLYRDTGAASKEDFGILVYAKGSNWWQRSPYPASPNYFEDVSGGTANCYGAARISSGVVPGFCI